MGPGTWTCFSPGVWTFGSLAPWLTWLQVTWEPAPLSQLGAGLAPRSKGKARAELRPARRQSPAATWTANAPRPHRAAGTEGSGRLDIHLSLCLCVTDQASTEAFMESEVKEDEGPVPPVLGSIPVVASLGDHMAQLQ